MYQNFGINLLSLHPGLVLTGAGECCTGDCPPLEEEEGWGWCTGSEEWLGDHLWHFWPGMCPADGSGRLREAPL